MDRQPQPDDFTRVLRELDELVDEAARLQRALDDARQGELASRRFVERRVSERRAGIDRRIADRRQP